MRKRWIAVFLLIYFFGIISILLTACAYNGNVTINTKDSFRLISPDLELYPEIKTETTIDNDDDGNPAKEEKR